MRSGLRTFGQRLLKKMLLALCAESMLVMIFWQGSASAALAEPDPVICGTCVKGGSPVALFVRGLLSEMLSEKDISAFIGNTPCEVRLESLRSSDEASLRTIVMLDNSGSIRPENREKAKKMICGLIANHMDGEEFYIYTFSSELTLVANGTDYASLQEAAEQIQFQDQDSCLSRCFSDLVGYKREIDRHSSQLCYDRILLISDGADDDPLLQGMTGVSEMILREEVTGPVYTAGSIWEKDTSGLKSLETLSEETNGQMFILDEEPDVHHILSVLAQDQEIRCLLVSPPPEEKDGLRKNVRVQVALQEEICELTRKIRIPEMTGTEKEAWEKEKTMASEEENETEEVIRPEEADTPAGTKWSKEILAACMITVPILLTAAGLFLKKVRRGTGRKKKLPVTKENAFGRERDEKRAPGRKKTDAEETAYRRGVLTGESLTVGEDPLLSSEDYDEMDERTIGQWDLMTCRILLTDKRGASRQYLRQLSEGEEFVIGRGTQCTLVISGEKTVSRRHCRVFMTDGMIMIQDAGSHNGTFINGQRLCGAQRLSSGDELMLGSVRFSAAIFRAGPEER